MPELCTLSLSRAREAICNAHYKQVLLTPFIMYHHRGVCACACASLLEHRSKPPPIKNIFPSHSREAHYCLADLLQSAILIHRRLHPLPPPLLATIHGRAGSCCHGYCIRIVPRSSSSNSEPVLGTNVSLIVFPLIISLFVRWFIHIERTTPQQFGV